MPNGGKKRKEKSAGMMELARPGARRFRAVAGTYWAVFLLAGGLAGFPGPATTVRVSIRGPTSIRGPSQTQSPPLPRRSRDDAVAKITVEMEQWSR